MNKKISIVIFFTLYSALLFSQATEKEAILKMAKSEGDAFLQGNLEEWQSYRVKSKDASITIVDNSGYNYIKSYDSINKTFTRMLKQMPKMTYSIKISNPVIEVNGNLAWAEYSQVLSITTKDTTEINPSNEMRVLNKEDGKWKILAQITTNTSPSKSTAENTLNTTGYQLLSANKINDAIEVFKLNVKLNPNSWNGYDSLGEAYALAGDKDLAKENYETSVRLNPKNENGITALKKLAK